MGQSQLLLARDRIVLNSNSELSFLTLILLTQTSLLGVDHGVHGLVTRVKVLPHVPRAD